MKEAKIKQKAVTIIKVVRNKQKNITKKINSYLMNTDIKREYKRNR